MQKMAKRYYLLEMGHILILSEKTFSQMNYFDQVASARHNPGP